MPHNPQCTPINVAVRLVMNYIITTIIFSKSLQTSVDVVSP